MSEPEAFIIPTDGGKYRAIVQVDGEEVFRGLPSAKIEAQEEALLQRKLIREREAADQGS